MKTEALILKDITLKIKRNEKIAILGPSGCGKTTLIYAIADLLNHDEIITSGNIRKGTITTSIVFQTPCLLQWKSVYENIAFALGDKNIDKKFILDLIRLVGLEGYENSHPSELSLGMQQRVNFIRALVVHPDLILLDEPFSALDSVTKKEVIAVFKDILGLKKISCLLVTHSKEEAYEIADTIVVLSKKPTTIKEIIKNKGKIESL